MKYSEFNRRVKNHLIDYKNNVLGIEKNGLYKGEEHQYILPGKIENNFLGDTYLLYSEYCNGEKLNKYCNHLNSSQIMCMNFFLPLIRNSDILNNIVSKAINIDKSELGEIKEYFFNAMHDEKNQFDLYLIYSNGYRIYLESKYTEEKFRFFEKDDKDKYWEENYKEFLQSSKYLKDLEKKEFFKDYQLNRNIGLIENNKDYVIFLYPFDNEKIQKKLENFEYDNVVELDWNEITYDTLKMVQGTQLDEYYREFSRKYLNY